MTIIETLEEKKSKLKDEMKSEAGRLVLKAVDYRQREENKKQNGYYHPDEHCRLLFNDILEIVSAYAEVMGETIGRSAEAR